jgi:hypothetical protein
LVATFRIQIWVFNEWIPYRDKKVVGVFVRFSCAASPAWQPLASAQCCGSAPFVRKHRGDANEFNPFTALSADTCLLATVPGRPTLRSLRFRRLSLLIFWKHCCR